MTIARSDIAAPLWPATTLAEHYQRVRAAYLRRAADAPSRIKVIDAAHTIEHVRQHVADIARTL